MNDIITLTGYLGKDPEIRGTKERTYTWQTPARKLIFEHRGVQTLDRDDDVAEAPVKYDVTVPSRDFAVLSLATHHWDGTKRITTWHRIVVWNVDRLEHIGVRIARKGSRVEITGRRTSFETREGQVLEQIELTNFRILQLQ